MIQKQNKFYTTKVCFQEIPDEISWTYFITNCPNRCPNCHSPHLRDDCGQLISQALESHLEANKHFISCILFMGGDDKAQVDSLIGNLIRCQEAGFKTALYSGFQLKDIDERLLAHLDYLKAGPYIQGFGPLNKQTTNQRLYKIVNGHIVQDITYKFWRRIDVAD